MHKPKQHNCLNPKGKSSATLLSQSGGCTQARTPLAHPSDPQGKERPPGHTSPLSVCVGRRYHKLFAFKCLALAEGFNKDVPKRCLVKFRIVSVKSWEQPSKKWTCRQTNVSQRFSPASPSPLATACLLLLLNFASLCKQSAMRGICSVHKFPAFFCPAQGPDSQAFPAQRPRL